MTLMWNITGWIRIYCGPDRSEITCEDPSRMVHVASIANTAEVVKDMDLPAEFTIWVQIGGSPSRRLQNTECPLLVQENFLKKLGFFDDSRRARLGIDPELKYLIRFHIGPAEIPMCRGVLKSGSVEILKGLVFPQWRRRSIAIIGCYLIIFPGNINLSPESYDLSTSEIFEHSPGYNRLIIKIVPKASDSLYNTKDNLHHSRSNDYLNMNHNFNASDTSVHSSNEREVVLFLGFEESWERDLWSSWLIEATVESSEAKRLDIGQSGLQTIPEVLMQAKNSVEELAAGHNRLEESAVRSFAEFKSLKVLRLPGNSFKAFPSGLLNVTGLTVLDLADNEIDKLPEKISVLQNLEELRVDRNALRELPNSLRLLKKLKSLQVSYNKLESVPKFLQKMRSAGGGGGVGVDIYSQNKPETFAEIYKNGGLYESKNKRLNSTATTVTTTNASLTKVNLRGNQLKGSIILGNYGYLTQLDISENSIEVLNLSALDKLETIQCCRNKLLELTINGNVLKSLIAGNNNIRKLHVIPIPVNLHHFDVSYNQLTELPDWIGECNQLRTLFANNNNIAALPNNIFNNEHGSLFTIQIGYNKLTLLPSMPKHKLPLQELFLQCNKIEELHENFFLACQNLTLLNVANNKLLQLPNVEGTRCQLERFYATNNCLTDRALESLVCFKNLKVIHAAYNRFTVFPEIRVNDWPDLEELVLSGNRIIHLPESLTNLRHLRVLRVHSNQLQSVPSLSRVSSLCVLDLAHNQLDKINIVSLIQKKLRFLDLSCNTQLQVDPKQVQVCKSQRQMSLVDVSGNNRVSLPTIPCPYQENTEFEPQWKVGFSETSGNSPKLYVSQLRLPGFCNSEGLFGMFDGEHSNLVPNMLVKAVPKILLEERTIKETANDYMKYTLLSAHRELKGLGQNHGVCAALCHILRNRISGTENGNYYNSSTVNGRNFILRIASVGDITVVLIRQNGHIKLTHSDDSKQIGNSGSFPIVVPDPMVKEFILGELDEYLLLANKKLWEVMSIDAVAEEIRKEDNVILSAKRIQDVAQSYGCEENLSIMIIKFNNLGTDVDFLMRELRQTIRKKSAGGSVISGFCKCGCCCEANNNCCHPSATTPGPYVIPYGKSDRSSPSGQSDQTSFSEHPMNVIRHRGDDHCSTISSKKSNTYISNEKRSLRGGVVRAVRARIEEEKEESDSAMSEEQFKCWEYMLEQNTQLLFDKELNTISRAFTKKKPQSNLTKSHLKSLSLSSPQLAMEVQNSKPGMSPYHTVNKYNNSTQFLSKHFGSARSFNPQTQNYFKPIRYAGGRVPAINGGPNAAYFGSLQRLMPYNLEYDFAAAKERSGNDSLEIDGNRMQQYWGVATTEL